MLSNQVPKLEEMVADDVRARLPRFQDANIEDNLRLHSALAAIARRKNATLAQLSIAWPMAEAEIDGNRFPRSPRQRPLCGILAKLAPEVASAPEYPAPKPPGEPSAALHRKRRR